MKIRLALLMLVLCSCPAAAQDMPLSQIIKEGEGWRLAATIANPLHLSRIGGYMVRTRSGYVYSTHQGHKVVFVTSPDGQRSKVELPVAEPTGLILTPEDERLVVADAAGKSLWSFRVENNGTLTGGEPYYALFLRRGETRSEARMLDFDTAGRLYVATKEGVQILDPTGRLCGVLVNPSNEPIDQMRFGNPNWQQLLIRCGASWYSRPLLAKGPVETETSKKP